LQDKNQQSQLAMQNEDNGIYRRSLLIDCFTSIIAAYDQRKHVCATTRNGALFKLGRRIGLACS
jgi:hypothetical protein